MKIFFQSKNPGMIVQAIQPVLLELDAKPEKVADLIRLTVEKIAGAYNRKARISPDDPSAIIAPYEEIEIQNLATTGRIAFGLIYNKISVSLEAAIETALKGYEDGLFKIFINNELLGDLDTEINIADGDLLTIVRLTFLSGRII